MPTMRALNDMLACPSCKGQVDVFSDGFKCVDCGFEGSIHDGIVHAARKHSASFFDSRHATMQQGNEDAGIVAFCYEQQSAALMRIAKAGSVLLDVGCGPKLAYAKPNGCVVIGLDPSIDSLRANRDLDVSILGSAEAIPLKTASIDVAVCFYSLHHMVGSLRSENQAKVSAAFADLGRVIRPGGALLVFDMSPWLPIWWTQLLFWNLAKRLLASKLDMFFWHKHRVAKFGSDLLPQAHLELRKFAVPLSTTFPPIFSLPAFRIPRALYPFDAMVYKWSF
jgi:SAM-dependent methyltransferase